MLQESVLDRFPSLRTLFAITWLAVQAALIFTAGRRINHAFGFHMFEESSTVRLHVMRLVDSGISVPLDDAWTARGCKGEPARYRWHDLVPAGNEWLDTTLLAPYGVEAALARARAAVAWVATHTPDDCETRALIATVTRVRNGRVLEDVSFVVRR